ncbi:MAG TPA: D-alanyl-D-alanine carboxypeptidase family protein [Acidimicrobiales bacterium]|nr:D-alanyl-D-alanine carboxypeptidase family protein [Acidimicrobiales bacterium]
MRFVRFPTPSLRSIATVLGALLMAGLVSVPAIGAAKTGDNPSAEREAVRAKKAQVATQVDALKATDAEVAAALDALRANVAGQESLLAEANRAAEEAEAAFAAATAAVQAKTAEIQQLRQEIRDFAVQAFVHPPADDAMAALDTADPGEAAQKRALLELQNTNDADLLDRLSSAEEDLEVERQLAEAASQRAEEKRAAAAGRLAELTSARDQQAAYAAQVEDRLARAMSEAAHLEQLDASLSAKIAAQQAELARKAAAAAASRRSSGGGGGAVTYNGSLATVSCPTGGSITVDSSIAGNVQSLLNAAPDSIQLCGWGWRSSQRQQELWDEHNCDTGCTVPTARPGSSMHERGLAIDFTSGGQTIQSRSSAAFQWLDAHANGYGLYNLPSEPWHWSTNGN